MARWPNPSLDPGYAEERPITGASSGLGAEIARQLAALGHDLALCARRIEKLEALRSEIAAAYRERPVEIRTLDVNDDDQVFEVFRAFTSDFGTIDRVVINAGLGTGAPLGTGRYEANKQTAMTNFVAALAQSEAEMEIFRGQDAGHFVMISSMSATRGLPKSLTTYAATKAGVAHLAEGLRNELYGKPIKVTVLYPGYIASEMHERVDPKRVRGMVSTEKGVRSMVDAIEKEKDSACVPRIAALTVAVNETVVATAEVAPGESVLDVATGTGHAALAAARVGARVTGIDYVPALLGIARQRAAAERLDVDFIEAPAEQLPFADDSFDVAVSAIGIMFAADHDRAAEELVRVVRPGGRIAVASWTRSGFVGGILGIVGRHVSPPPGAQSPVRWGEEDVVAELLGDAVEQVGSSVLAVTQRFRDAEAFADLILAYYGPTHSAARQLDESGRAALRADLVTPRPPPDTVPVQ